MSRLANNIWEFNCHLPPGCQIAQPKLTFCPSGPTLIGNHFLTGYQTQLESKQQTKGLYVSLSLPSCCVETDHLQWKKKQVVVTCSIPGTGRVWMPVPSSGAPSSFLSPPRVLLWLLYLKEREGNGCKRTTHVTFHQSRSLPYANL